MIDIFLNNIAWLRKHHGLSKKEMARKLKISVWTLNRIERGELPPRLSCDMLFAVWKNFGVSISDILSLHLGSNERNFNNV